MTTIVVDQTMGIMAGDRMVTTNDGEVAISCDTKIERVDIGGDIYLVGMAGMEGPAEHFLDWFRDGDWDTPPDKAMKTAITMDPNTGFGYQVRHLSGTEDDRDVDL
jgi:hypothetical protein